MAAKQYIPIPPLSENFIEYFWKRVNVQGDNDCWFWNGPTNGNGYGRVSIQSRGIYPHRIAYFLSYKIDPVGFHVLHRCIASKACCNPFHLYLGTDTDNTRDKQQQFRNARKLDREEVMEIRTRYARGGLSTRELAILYGVHQANIWRIVTRKIWPYA